MKFFLFVKHDSLLLVLWVEKGTANVVSSEGCRTAPEEVRSAIVADEERVVVFFCAKEHIFFVLQTTGASTCVCFSSVHYCFWVVPYHSFARWWGLRRQRTLGSVSFQRSVRWVVRRVLWRKARRTLVSASRDKCLMFMRRLWCL